MKLLTHMIDRDQGWFRIVGIGLLWKHRTIPKLFSERHGYVRFIRIPGTPWRVRFLLKGSSDV